MKGKPMMKGKKDEMMPGGKHMMSDGSMMQGSKHSSGMEKMRKEYMEKPAKKSGKK